MKRLIAALAVFLPTIASAQILPPDFVYPTTPAQVTSYDSTSRIITARSLNGGVLRVLCTTDCYVALAGTPHASTTTGMFLYQNTANWFLIRRNDRIAVIQSSAGGTIHVQELSR